jgi:hypothetical protein
VGLGVAVGEAGISWATSGVGVRTAVGVWVAAGTANAGVDGLPPHATNIVRSRNRDRRQYHK